MNSAFEQSGLSNYIVFRLVHCDEFPNDGLEYTTFDTALPAFKDNDDITALRDKVRTHHHHHHVQYGADVVAGVFGTLSEYCGLGYVYANAQYSFSEYPYHILSSTCISYYTYSHETGHNFGGGHDMYDAVSTSRLNYYNIGWHWVGTDSIKYR